jgi:hypothetical protein
MKRLGTLQPKAVHEIGTSRWTLGCETIDREYSDYHAFKAYLPALGINASGCKGAGRGPRKIRVSTTSRGWTASLTTRAPAGWRSGWRPVLAIRLSGRRGTHAGGGMPTSEEGLRPGDRWVEQMALRYKNKVRDWSMWNEPELKGANGTETITAFNMRTAEIIKRINPDARIAALVLCNPKLEIIEPFLKTLKEQNKLHLFDWIVYHHYTHNPDQGYEGVVKARELVRSYAPAMKLWQGESGTQSEWCRPVRCASILDRTASGEVECAAHVGRHRARLGFAGLHRCGSGLPHDLVP